MSNKWYIKISKNFKSGLPVLLCRLFLYHRGHGYQS